MNYAHCVELKQVRCLAAVADHGSFRRAAAAMPLAQPAVSTHIARLETELGVELLTRTRRGAELTAAGEVLLPALRSLLETEQAVHRTAQDLSAGAVGRVRIAAINAAIGGLVAPALATLRAGSAITIDLTESTPEHIEAAIDNRDIDIGLTAHPGRFRPAREAESLTADRIGLCVNGQSPLASQRTASQAGLVDEQLIILDEGLLHRLAIGYFPQPMIDRAYVVTHHWTALDLVNAGLGIALTPSVSLLRYPDLVWIPIGDARLTATLWMLTSADPSPATGRVTDAIRAQVEVAVAATAHLLQRE